MNAKIFSYKADIVLEPQDDKLKISKAFDRKIILEPIKELLAADNYKVDEASLNFKIVDDELFIQGLAVENQEVKEVGFRFGK